MDEKKVPEEVKYSQFGCGNCLWAGVECTSKNGNERYSPKKSFNGKPSCGGYAYFD